VPGALPHLDLVTPAAAAQMFFHGAHLARWTPAHARQPVLRLSAHSHFRPDKAIRGGVPICFPWFGPHASDPKAPSHGFARLLEWTVRHAAQEGETVTLAFELETDERTSPLWPHRSRVVYRLSIGAALGLSLQVHNTGAEPFTFEEALHSYFAVSDIEQVSIGGLEQTEYLDKVEGFARQRQGDEPIRFAAETDRVYLDTTAACTVTDPGWSRTITVRKTGSRATVIWNPWAEKARTFADFGPDEWRQMVCVETANVGASAVRLEPGAVHTMGAEIYCSDFGSP
jgi:glucose-6-phosphate 1-epimerase